MEDWTGKRVQITLKKNKGIFQGSICGISHDYITINNCFHNGFKLRGMEAKIGKDEIEKIDIVSMSDSESPKQEVPEPKPKIEKKNSHPPQSRTPSFQQPQPQPHKNEHNKKQRSKHRAKNAFDIEVSEEEFDFEKNLALFDKEAIFKEIEREAGMNGHGNGSNPKPDLVRQIPKRSVEDKKYRHDENVLQITSSFRQVQLEQDSKNLYYTDDGICIPSIPQSLRNRVQNLADNHGFDMNRQNDMLARGACDLALQLLGGSRRLTPKNQHQWPKLVVICDEPYNDKQSEVGISTARLLASHGLKVMIYVKTTTKTDKPSKELELFTATGNDFTYSIKDLNSSDLVILAVKSMNLNSLIVRYIQNNRAPVLAIDPPITGVSEVSIKYSILPILPLDDVINCGKLYLCNLGIPEKFFRDSGVKYYSPFGSKYIIPLHLN